MTPLIPGTGIEATRALARSARPDAPVLPDNPPGRLTAWLRRVTRRPQPRARQPQLTCTPVADGA